MGKAAASSKSKKNSSEDRRKRKNPKSRKRRRVSRSPSSYSSDPDDVSRRRRSSRRKPEKRRGRDPKRSVKRKIRKARLRSVSSGSSDSLNGSRSPTRGRDDRKGKLKKKVKRGRKLDRDARSLRSRDRSVSCSTCSGSSGPSQIHSYRKGRSKERGVSRQLGSSSAVESRGEVEVMYESGDREIDNEMILANYDDSRLTLANVGRDVDRVEEDRVMDEGSDEQGAEIDRWMSECNVENDSYLYQFEDSGTQASEPYKELELNAKFLSRIKSEIVAADKHDSESDDLELMLRQKALENLKKLRGGLSSDNSSTDKKNELAGDESSEKQCETAGKLISSTKSDTIVARDESSEKQCETAKKLISSSKSHAIVAKERDIQLGVPSHDSKVNPVLQLPSLEANYSTSDKKTLFTRLNQSRNSKQVESSMSGQSTSNLPNNMEDSTEKLSHRQSPSRGSQEKIATAGCGSDNNLRSDVNLGDGLASGNTFPNGKEKIRENIETADEYQSGSQFEQKTFSRMHDGEMVQVNYKVYIPKKAPALARRKLQR